MPVNRVEDVSKFDESFIKSYNQESDKGCFLEDDNRGLVLKKTHRVIKFNQKSWLKPYIDMNTDVRKAAKMISKKFFSTWWIIQFSKKLWKKFENIGTISLSQHK